MKFLSACVQIALNSFGLKSKLREINCWIDRPINILSIYWVSKLKECENHHNLFHKTAHPVSMAARMRLSQESRIKKGSIKTLVWIDLDLCIDLAARLRIPC